LCVHVCLRVHLKGVPSPASRVFALQDAQVGDVYVLCVGGCDGPEGRVLQRERGGAHDPQAVHELRLHKLRPTSDLAEAGVIARGVVAFGAIVPPYDSGE